MCRARSLTALTSCGSLCMVKTGLPQPSLRWSSACKSKFCWSRMQKGDLLQMTEFRFRKTNPAFQQRSMQYTVMLCTSASGCSANWAIVLQNCSSLITIMLRSLAPTAQVQSREEGKINHRLLWGRLSDVRKAGAWRSFGYVTIITTYPSHWPGECR